MKYDYDCIVVGGGHAGCEACLATAKMGYKTLLLTGNINNIADMPCNPSIGGSAKGIVVREIDALGGVMGDVADKTHIQLKMLNVKKGPGVRSLRAQSDKKTYPKYMIEIMKKTENLSILENIVEDLIVENNTVYGIITKENKKITSKKTILTTGTYMKSFILRGDSKTSGGPHGEKESKFLSENLKKYGLPIIQLKTGTPPRIDKNTINFDVLEKEDGDKQLLSFSNFYEPNYDYNNQTPCHIAYTNNKTHEIIMENLKKSSLYGGLVHSVGPRYCPSIEDKIVKFKDKERHQLFIEPQSLDSDSYYLGGFSTSMPIDIQEKMVHSIKGLENTKILEYAYAIEYDAIDPINLQMSLESKIIKNLYTAGQINGTSGYEEAAAQGLIAGINASLSLNNKGPLILKRNEAYIGVLIDDIVNKGITEPYRLLTSRAEFRLLLRHDNASLRLAEFGHNVGLLTEEKFDIHKKNLKEIESLREILSTNYLENNEITNSFLNSCNSSSIKEKIKLIDILKRQEINIINLLEFLKIKYNKKVAEQVDINIKYEGYIRKTKIEVDKMLRLESKKIPLNMDYFKVHNIATEAKQKLDKFKPLTIGQASRISGVNPSDISVLLIYLKKEYPYE